MSEVADIMIDLETFGTLPGSAFFSIGLVQFWPERPKGVNVVRFGAATTIPVCMTSALLAGLDVDQRTIDWWRTQAPDLRLSLEGGGKPLAQALWAVDEFLHQRGHESSRVWAHGTHFDISLLETAYKKVGKPAPWKYNRVRDTRTFYDAVRMVEMWEPPERDPTYVAHNAVFDAMHQAECVVSAYDALRSASKTESR